MKLFLDASSISDFYKCPEYARRTYTSQTILGVDYPTGMTTLAPNIYYHFGIAIHTFVEEFWKGQQDQTKLTDVVFEVCNQYPVSLLNPPELETWKRMVGGIPDLVAAYLEAVPYEPERLLNVETEWSYPYEAHQSSGRRDYETDSVVADADGVRSGIYGNGSSGADSDIEIILCGRMDRTMIGPSLVDVKTASEIASGGVSWKQAYREEKLIEVQFGLYDWKMQRTCKCGHLDFEHTEVVKSCKVIDCECSGWQSMAPKEVYLEVLLKPYKTKAARYQRIDLNEIVTPAYRKRFEQQLAFKVSQIVQHYRDYANQKPWELNVSACSSKYGRCSMIGVCTAGETEKTMKKFVPRVPHLQLVRLG